jgi:arylsulfatase A-like enzyme
VWTRAPHQPAIPAPRYKNKFKNTALPRPPSFDEANVKDKPRFIRNLPRLSDKKISKMRRLHRGRLASMLSVEDLLKRVVGTLKNTGELDNTYIFLPANRVLKHQVLNNDLAPTFAGLAGVKPPAFVDGKSMVPLLDASPPSVSNWRTGFLTENWRTDAVRGASEAPTYKALRTKNYLWVKYVNGERELYDMRKDPNQLKSLNPKNDRRLVRRLNGQLDRLGNCHGRKCRAAETG